MWIGADDDESLRALRRAIELGVNFIDTAHGYGDGPQRAAGRPGRARLRGDRLCGDEDPAEERALAGAGRRSRRGGVSRPTGSSRRPRRASSDLGLETIDVQQFHVWSDEWVGQGDWLDAIEQLKGDGKIRFFGVSINDHQPANAVKLVESGHVDTVQVIYNVFDQSPEDELFPACRGGERRRDRARAVRRGLAHRPHPARHRVPDGRLPPQLLRRRPQAAGVGPRAGDRRRPRCLGRRARRDRPALLRHASRPSRPRSPACARCGTSSGTSPRSTPGRCRKSRSRAAAHRWVRSFYG